MNDLLAKAKALESLHRKNPETPRGWADSIIKDLFTIDNAPEHFRAIIGDHIETHSMMVNAKAKAILALPNGKARLEYFNGLDKEMQPHVKKRVHEIKSNNAGNHGPA